MKNLDHAAAVGLLALMGVLAGGAALRESVTVDEVAHIGAGLSYLQRLDLRLNGEHPPLGKVLAALPLAIRGTHADYAGAAWKVASDFFPAYGTQWPFGDAILGRWNDWKSTLAWARLPMLVLTLLLGWFLYRYGKHLGGSWGGLLCLAAYVTTPAFLVFGPLVLTDLPVTLFSLLALWQLGEIWAAPSPRKALLFGAALGAALASKFTGLLVIAVVLVLFVQTRFWPTAAQPVKKEEAKLWRKARWQCVWRGLLWAALFVYALYFVLSWNQPDSALNLIGSGSWAWLIRRPLMPLWLYLRGLLFMLVTGSRTTYLFGHSYSHGVPFYYPVVFAFKSTLGFLLLLVVAGLAWAVWRKPGRNVIPEEVRPHWRVLMAGFFVFLAVCLLSQLNIGIRHFLLPIALLVLMLAPLPRMIAALPGRRLWQTGVTLLALSSFVAVAQAYPYYFPFVNSLAFGRPVYTLVNDSNVSWNEALPEVEHFAREQGLTRLPLDFAALNDPAVVVPEAEVWDCQAPTDRDAGQWVAVTAIVLLEDHNCGYLQQYPHKPLAGGSFYAFRLPAAIPPTGTPGGPPLASERRAMWGMPFDIRSWCVNVERHPERLQAEMQAMMDKFKREWEEAQAKKRARKSETGR
jgi:hypothetical protein